MAEVVIIGAGLTGLSAAYHLEQLGISDYKIFEKKIRPGGLLCSKQQDGFTFDYTGHLLHINNTYFRNFLDHIAGLENFDFIHRKTGIFSNNIFSDYPFQMNLYNLPTDVTIDCIEGYVKRATHIKKPKNFYEWVLKYFGAGFGKHFFFPYNKKILAYNLKKVHPSWTGRFVPSTNLRSIIKGTIEKNLYQKVGYNSSFYYPKKGGIEFLIKQLCKKIKKPIQTSYRANHIDLTKKTIFFENGNTERYKYLISTMPLSLLLNMLSSSPRSKLKSCSHKLLCNSVINLNLGFNVGIPQKMHWVYFPEKKYPFYRLGFWHNISKTSVPQSHSAVYGECSFLPQKTSCRQMENMTNNVFQSILNFLKLEQQHIAIQKTLHLKHAYVIYDRWREENLHKILSTLKELNINSIGRYGAWKYSSMEEAVIDGKITAEEIYQQFVSQKKLTFIPALHKTRSKKITEKEQSPTSI